MPLTPEDVHKKTFTPVRLREGYDMTEVDQFLDEVEVELTRLHADNDDLREKLGGVQTGAPAAAPTAGDDAASPAQAPAAPAVKTVPEAASAAARLLELAAQNADQLVGESHEQADKIVAEARTKAERLEADSKSKAARLESDARTRADQLDSETTQRREKVLGELERDRDGLAGELDELRAFEREYRSRLKGYFERQLRVLDGEADETDDTDGDAAALASADGSEPPRRLRELLGEDQPG